MISEKIELLGKGLYDSIPDTLTLKSIPTASELEYVGSEDFDKVMLDSILPSAIDEKINFYDLLEMDYQWVCRCLRILNYGPYYTTNMIFCSDCGKTSYGEYQVNLNTINCKALPDKFVNELTISKDEFIDFDQDITVKLPTIRDIMNAYKDKAFQKPNGKSDRELARICYMISSIGGTTTLSPIEIKIKIQNELSSADYILLKNAVSDLTDYGLRIGGVAQCPACRSMNGAFIALVDDRFFRPTVGDLRSWKHDRSTGENKDISGSKTTTVRKHN